MTPQREFVTALLLWHTSSIPPDFGATVGILTAEFVACVYSEAGFLCAPLLSSEFFTPSSFCSAAPVPSANVNSKFRSTNNKVTDNSRLHGYGNMPPEALCQHSMLTAKRLAAGVKMAKERINLA